MTVVLTFAGPCEPLTSNQRLNRYVRAGRVKQWRARAHVAIIQAGKPRLKRAHVTCTLHFTDARRRDAGNWYDTAKACLDGIVDAGALVDDSDRFVIGPDMRRGEKAPKFAVTITLDDTCRCIACVERFEATA